MKSALTVKEKETIREELSSVRDIIEYLAEKPNWTVIKSLGYNKKLVEDAMELLASLELDLFDSLEENNAD